MNENRSIFQKKIDPSLDDLIINRNCDYSTNKTMQANLKVLVVSYEKIPILGHISRTG